MKNRTALLVISCDAYSDLWPIFIRQFEKHWPDCPFDKYISTNFLSAESASFTDIPIGDDITWSNGLRKALDVLKDHYEFVLVTLEDLILVEKVENQTFNRIVKGFHKMDGNYIKFIRKPRPVKMIDNESFGIIPPKSLYRPTCVYALWRIETLVSLLRNKENAWEFERYGSIRSDKIDGFYVVRKDFFKVANTIVKGKFVPSQRRKLIKEGNQIFSERKTLSPLRSIVLNIKTIIFNAFTSIIPWQYRRPLVFFFKRMEIDSTSTY
jgi:hypothetical protein